MATHLSEDKVLIWAAKKGYHEIVECLVKKETDVNARDCSNFTSLHQAS